MGDSPRRLMIYAYYDRDGQLRPYARYALERSREICGEIVFVSNSALSKRDREALSSLCAEVHVRQNDGCDFGMWKFGLQRIAPHDWDELVLFNSSVYGPVFPLKDAFDAMEQRACDFWGMTDSYEPAHHLQSYFLVFRKDVIRSEAFREFWSSVLPYQAKDQVIRSYEVGLSQWLTQRGFRMAAYCPWPKLIRHRNAKLRPRKERRKRQKFFNPSVKSPLELLELRMPFVKKEVLRENPYRLDLAPLEDLLLESGYPSDCLLDEPPAQPGPIQADQQRACPLCGAEGEILYRRLKDAITIDGPRCWHLSRCPKRSCGAMWLDPMPRREDIRKAYENYYTHPPLEPPVSEYRPPAYTRTQKRILACLNGLLWKLGLHGKREIFYLHGLSSLAPGRLLEVGCGSGARLAALKKMGWEVEGQEIDEKAAEHCRSLDLTVHVGPLEEIDIPRESFDWILLAHVLEHVHDPVGLLKDCLGLLRPGGQIVASTPNVRALGRFIYRKHWCQLEPPRHLILFAPKALKRAFSEAGFADVDVSTIPYNMELFAMFSRDIRYNGFTDFDSGPRLGKEMVPTLLQLCALALGRLLPWNGEECLARARKPGPPLTARN